MRFTNQQLLVVGGIAAVLYFALGKGHHQHAAASSDGFCSYADCVPELANGGSPQDAGKQPSTIKGVAADIAQSLQEQQFLDAQSMIGIDTVGQVLSNPVLDLRGGYQIDKVNTLFNQSQIMPQDVGPQNRISIGVGNV